MTVLSTLHCDDDNFAEWSSTFTTGSGVIEQVATSRRNGERGLHAVCNGGVARAELDNWATPMTNLGDIRAVGFWARIQAYPTATPVMFRLEIGGLSVARLSVYSAGTVRMTIDHDGGTTYSDLVACFEALNKWYYIQVALIRHATEGGVQVYRNAALIIDETALDTSTKFGQVITASTMYAGARTADATLEIDMDEFCIATTVGSSAAKGGSRRPMMGVGS